MRCLSSLAKCNTLAYRAHSSVKKKMKCCKYDLRISKSLSKYLNSLFKIYFENKRIQQESSKLSKKFLKNFFFWFRKKMEGPPTKTLFDWSVESAATFSIKAFNVMTISIKKLSA
jgi:hypothetical protein